MNKVITVKAARLINRRPGLIRGPLSGLGSVIFLFIYVMPFKFITAKTWHRGGKTTKKREFTGAVLLFWVPMLLLAMFSRGFAYDYSPWTYHGRIYINTTSTGADITETQNDFPLLVRLEDGINFTFSQVELANGGDIRFSTSNDDPLDYERENWGASDAEFWVEVDEISGNSNTQYIKIHWGNDAVSDESSSTATFAASNNYTGVWHLNEASGGVGAVKDATSNGYNGSDGGTPTFGSAGQIDDAISFVGNSGYVDMGDVFELGTGDWTITLWISQNSGTDYRAAVAKGTYNGAGDVLIYDLDNNSGGYFCFRNNDNSGTEILNIGPNSTLVGTGWRHLAVTREGNTLYTYLDGASPANATIESNYDFNNDHEWTIGCRTSGPGTKQNYIDAVIDEVRISSGKRRSADWITLCFENQKDNSTVVSIPKIWSGGGGASDYGWTTAANWNVGVAPATTDKILLCNVSSKNCVLDGNVTVVDITLTPDYTGTFDFGSSSYTLTVTGDADFSTGGPITAGDGTLEFTGTSAQTFTPKSGQTFPEIEQDGSGGTTVLTNGFTANTLSIEDGSFNLGTSLTHTVGAVTTPGGTGGVLNFGSSTLQATGNVTLNGSGFSVTAGTGELNFTGTGTQTFTPDGATHPDISHTGSGTFDIGGNFTCGDFNQSAGVLDFNGYDITASDFFIENGTASTIQGLTNVALSVSGVAELNGQSGNLLNLSGGAWSINMTTDGALSAMFSTINFSTVPSAAPLGQAEECVDGGSNTAGDWNFISENYNTWTYSKKVYINTTSSGADVSSNVIDFPILLRLNTGNIDFAQVQGSSGEDMRFAKSDGIHLSYEIEDWNDGTDASIWVKIDTVYGNNDTQYFIMYWGKTGATSRSNPTKVFATNNDFEGVWHMGSTQDATDHNLDFTESGNPTTPAGLIGDCKDLDGTGDYLTRANSGYLDMGSTFTAYLWVNYEDGALPNDYERMLTRKGNYDDADGWEFSLETNHDRALTVRGSSDAGWIGAASVADSWSAGGWEHIAVVFNGTTASAYGNGVLDADVTVASVVDNNDPLYFGRYGSGPWTLWVGKLDEVRLDDALRSADWIKLCYETQKSGSKVVNFPKIWDGGGSDNNWSTAANWSGNTVPSTSDDVVFNNTSTKNCVLDASVNVTSTSFSSTFTGNFSFGTGSYTLDIEENADFSTGGSITAGDGTLEFSGTSQQTFTPKSGQTFPDIEQTNTGGTVVSTNSFSAGALSISSGTLDLSAEGLVHSVTTVTVTGGGLDFGTSTLEATGNVNLNNAGFTVTPGTGTVKLTGSGTQTFIPKSSGSHPSISHTGTGTFDLAANVSCISFSQSGGDIDFNEYDITTTGNFTLSNGTPTMVSGLANVILTVGGNATFSGSSGSLLNINTNSWSVVATGNLSASYATLDYSNATGGTQGEAASTCNYGSNNTNWTYDSEDYGTWSDSKNLYINTTTTGADVSGDVANFPLLIRFDASNFTFADAAADGSDIRFTDSEGTPIPYEIEEWDNSTPTASVWVLVNNVVGNNKTQYIKMYWDDTKGGSSKSSPTTVFQTTNSFEAVWHLSDLQDATGNNLDVTQSGNPTTPAGLIADCKDLDGNDYLSRANSALLDMGSTFTAYLWVNYEDGAAPNDYEKLFDRKDPWNTTDGWHVTLESGYDKDLTVRGSSDAGWIAGKNVVTSWAAGGWHHIAIVYNGTVASVYSDGVFKSDATINSVVDNNDALRIGVNNDANDNYWVGKLDEVRIDDALRSADWIKLCYETQKTDAACVYLSDAPIITGLNDSAYLAAYQNDADSVYIDYEVEDPNGGTVTITAEYKPDGGSSWSDMTNTRGEGSIAATDGDVDRQVGWNARLQLGQVENDYSVRIHAYDGTSADTTESGTFSLDTRSPTGLGSFATSNVTGTTVDLSWDAVNDANWDHYEIWYGTNQTKVDERNTAGGDGAVEWDGNDDSDMNTMATTSTTINGLSNATQYYFKIYAVDSWVNEDSLAIINTTTLATASPFWTTSSLGAIQGGAAGSGRIFIGCGASSYSFKAMNLTNGNQIWTVSTFPDACGMPTYFYDSNDDYLIVAPAGTKVYGVKDNGVGDPTSLFTKDLSPDSPGTPYIEENGNYFLVVHGTDIGKYSMTDGSSAGSPWPITPTYAPSSAADILIYNDELYAATSGPRIFKADMDGTDISYSSALTGGGSVNLPLNVSSDGSKIYVTPTTSKLIAVNTSGLSEAWDFDLQAGNTGAAFVVGTKIYVGCGNYVQRITDNDNPSSADWTSNDLLDAVYSGPIPFNNAVYVGRDGGQIHVLKDSDGKNYNATKWPYSSASGDANTGPWIDVDNDRIIFGTDGGELHSFEKESLKKISVKRLIK